VDDASSSNRPDLSAYWMPFTANRQFKADPRLFVAARGLYYRTEDGREVLDATSGLWCVNAGHGRPEIAEAVQRQLLTLDYAPAFQMSHPAAFELASRIAELTPAGLDRIFFTNSGSEAVETALKIALAYHRARGEGQRTRFIGRERAYHGVNFGGMSVGGLVNNRRTFTLLPGVDHLRHTHDLERNAFSRGQPAHGAELADELERRIALHGADTIAAVIVEPVAGSGGVLPPPVGYLERLRAICDRHGLILIFDEVITGFGRLGSWFGSQHYGVTPDMMTFAKAVTSGYLPLGGVFVGPRVREWLEADPAYMLAHGNTYTGHPTCCAAGVANINLMRAEDLPAKAAAAGKRLGAGLGGLVDHPGVAEIRGEGLVWAIGLAPSIAPGPFTEALLQRGVIGRGLPYANSVAYSPPLIITDEEVDELLAATAAVLDELA